MYYNINKYNCFVNIYNKILRRAKQTNYDKKIQEYSSNMRKTWETICEVTGKQKNKINIPEYFCNGNETVSGDRKIAEGFNNFFSSIGPDLAKLIPPSEGNFSSFLGKKVDANFILC